MAGHHETLREKQRIDAICDRFEAAWHGDHRLAIDSLLSEVADDRQADLFDELLVLEIELRSLAGESPQPDEYREKFPQFAGRIAMRFTGVAGPDCRSAGSSGNVQPATGPALGSGPAGGHEVKPDDRTQSSDAPSRFGRFELLGVVGQGGFGTVWKAFDPLLNRSVALKIPRHGPKCPRDTAIVLQEARAAARLRHAAVVQVHEVGEEGNTVYIATEYIEGCSLREYLSEHRMPVRQVIELAIRLADALHHAHGLGVIHRDVNPSNILLDSTQSAWIADFGLAHHLDSQDGQGQASEMLGTLAYMPPEYASGNAQSADARADIYSLGVVLFELLTGRRPFEGDGDSVRQAILEQVPTSPRRLNPEISRNLDAICLKCLAKDPGRRYRTAEDLSLDLTRFLRGEPVDARPIAVPIRIWLWCRRKPILAGMILTIVLLMLAIVAGSLVHSARTAALLRVAQSNLYFHRILAAQHSWDDNKIDFFRTLLKECPEEQRKWEWYFLRNLPKSADKTLELAGGWVTYSPDGTRIATAGCERAVKIWDAHTGEMLFALRGHEGFPSSVSFSPDGGRVASAGGSDKTVMLWDLASRRSIGRFSGHRGSVVRVRFSADGRRLVSAGLDKTARIWDIGTGKELHCLRHEGRVWAIDVSPDGRWIASVSGKGGFSRIQFWDFESGQKVWELRGFGREADLAFSPDGKRFAVADGRAAVRVFDCGSREQIQSIVTHAGQHPHVTYSSDGSFLASNQWNNSIKIWNAATGAEVRTIRGQTSHVQSLAFRSGGTELAFGTTHDFVFVYDIRNEPGTVTLRGHGEPVSCLAFSPDGAWLASGGEDGTLRLWSPKQSGSSEVLTRLDTTVRAVAFSPDSRRLAINGEEATVQVWDLAQRKCALVLRGHDRPVQSIVYSPDGTMIAAAGRGGRVNVWDAIAGQVLHSLTTSDQDVRSVAFSPCSRWLAVAGRNHRVEMRRLETGRVDFTFDCKYPAIQMQFHPSGQVLAIATSDGSFRFWNFQAGRSHVGFARKLDRSRTTLAFSPDGTRFVTASEQDAVRLWDREHERQLLTLVEGVEVSGLVSFSPCGSYIAAACSNDIRIWKGGSDVAGVGQDAAK